MKKRVLILLMVVCFLAEAGAQHCAWDFTNIIMVDVKQKGGEGTIGGLKVTLTDASGKCVSTYNDSCLQFVQNKPTGIKEMPYVRQEYLKYKRPSFFFMQEQYVMIGHSNMVGDGFYVKIEDMDGEANGGYFETILVPVKKENFLSLCGNARSCPRYNQSCVDPAMIKIELGDSITEAEGKRRKVEGPPTRSSQLITQNS